MADAVLRVSFAGPQVSVQDGGRRGFMRFGVPASGAMDRKALTIANVALGNAPGAAGIEVSLGGLALTCEQGAVTLAVAGGGFALRLASHRLSPWSVLTLRAGQTLTLRAGDWGSWAYVAFAGRLVAPDWLGAQATHALSGFGGGAIRTGQSLTLRDAAERPDREGDLPLPAFAQPRHDLRVIMGPQDRYFPPEAVAALLSQPFVLTDACDRMGVRLRGPALMPDAALSIPSAPISRGSVQVAGDGVATVLLADHQTTGGYPKIATVLGSDLDGFTQCRAGDAVRFAAIAPPEAIALSRASATELGGFLQSIAQPRGSLAQRLASVNLISGVVDADPGEDGLSEF